MIANNMSNACRRTFYILALKRKRCYFEIFAYQIYESFLECTSKIYPASGRSEVYTCAAVSYMDFHGGLQTDAKSLRRKWKNSLDIISNFFETRDRYARLARSLTHVQRRVTVKHLAPAGAGYVT